MRFLRCTNPEFIPRTLLKQLPNKDFDADSFYTFMGVALQSPTSLLFLLIDEKNVIRGFLWAEINVLEQVMFVNLLSVDKELWGNGSAIDLATDFLKKRFVELSLKKVVWITDRPALFERKGFKQAKEVLLEYTGE